MSTDAAIFLVLISPIIIYAVILIIGMLAERP